MTNYEILQEYEKNGTPLPKYEEFVRLLEDNKALKEENSDLKESLNRIYTITNYK